MLSSSGSVGTGVDLTATSGGSTIEGLQFNGFGGSAILVESANNTIGGTSAGAGNVVGTSGSAGVSITGASNVLEGNFIGTDAAGDKLGNDLGVLIDNGASNTIGGTSVGSGNTIAFSTLGGGIDLGRVGLAQRAGGELHRHERRGREPRQRTGRGDRPGLGQHGGWNGDGRRQHDRVQRLGRQPRRVDRRTAGTGNAILNNLFYGNTGSTFATTGIDLTNGGNDEPFLPAPVISGVFSSGSGATTITLNVTGMIAGTYLLDVFASAPGSTPISGQVAAQVPLATFQNVAIASGQTSLTETIMKALSGGQQVTATWTVTQTTSANLTAGDTSEFAATAAVPQPFVVTTTATSGAGSLAFEINAVNGDTTNPNPDTIQFQLSTGDPNYNATTNVWTISLNAQSGPLPTITHPVILDATTQAGYAGTPVVEIDGDGLSGDGLDLGTSLPTDPTSSGSTIRGLIIVGFAGAGIDVESDDNLIQSNVIGSSASPNTEGVLISGSTNTIGGTAAGAGNVIAYNTGAAVDASNGTDNTIRGNLIFSNGQAIVPSPGENPPGLTAAISVGGTTTIEGTVGNSPPIGTILDFYANPGLQPPSSIYLGSYLVTSASSSFTAILSISVPTGATITATATSPAGNTSALSAPVSVVNPLAVTNTNDDGVGSLRQALESANQNGGLATIIFDLPAGTMSTIVLASPLPMLHNPVVMDATGLETASGVPVVVIDGQGLSGTPDGLDLGPGSDNSTIKGLDIIDFGGDGIDIASTGNIVQDNYIGIAVNGTSAANGLGIAISGSGNTIGGVTSLPGNSLGGPALLNGAANVIAFNTGAAVNVTAGTGEVIRQNLIFGNGSGISNSSGATAPSIIAVSSVPNLTTIDYTVNGTNGQTYAIDFYTSKATGGPAGLVPRLHVGDADRGQLPELLDRLHTSHGADQYADDHGDRDRSHAGHVPVRRHDGESDEHPLRGDEYQRQRAGLGGRVAPAGDPQCE